MELSQQFVELGFLPEGYERYCGVKVGEVRAKRSASGAVSPSKRPRERETIYSCRNILMLSLGILFFLMCSLDLSI